MKKILWYVLVSVLLVMACSQAFAEVAAPDGYTKLNGGYMVKKKANNVYDLRGLYNNKYIQTTFQDKGYEYQGDQSIIDNGVVTTSVESVSATDGRFARLIYTVTAGSARITNGKLAVHADVEIDSDDYAPIEVIKNGTDVIGISMKNSDNNAQFSLYFRDAIGVTNSDTYWFGHFSSRYNHAFETLSEFNDDYGTYENGLDKLVDTDSGFAVSWHNINLNPGESKSFSIIVGVGEAARPITWDQNDSPLKLDLTEIEQGTDSVVATGKANEENINLMLFYSINGSDFEPVRNDSVNVGTGMTSITGSVPTADLPVGEHKLAFFIRDTTSMSMSSTEEITLVVKAADPNKNPNVVGAIKDLPQTGDNSSLGLYIMMLGFASLAMVVMKRRRVEN